MNRKLSIAALSLALSGACGVASATETTKHNDMDGDGRSDLIWRNANTGAIVYWSSGNPALSRTLAIGNYYPGFIYDPHRYAPVFAASDLWSYPSRNMLALQDSVDGVATGLSPAVEGNGSNYTFARLSGSGCAHDFAAVGDFDGDEAADMFCRNPATGEGYFFLGFQWGLGEWGAVYRPAPTVAIAWKVVGAGDFDGDGRSDVLWRHATTGRNAIWRSGNSATRLGIATVSNLDWQVAAIGDFNGDRRSDILWRNSRTGANVIWTSGSSLTQQAVRGVTDPAWKVVATGDFDGDGKWDLTWRNSATGVNVLWRSANAATPQALPRVALAWSGVM